MQVVISESHEVLFDKLANRLLEMVSSIEIPLISPASGDSPAGLYQKLVQKRNGDELNVANWKFVGLDEWMGMNQTDEGSCRYHLNKQLFSPLEIEEKNICFFDGRSEHPLDECARTDQFIQECGGIDVAILGLGMNGHIGMNEPGTNANLHSHVTKIAAITQQVGQKYFKSEQKLTSGITLGMATLLQAKHLILIVTGEHKSSIVQKFFQSALSSQVPATLLRDHPGLEIFLDKPAAQLVNAYVE